MPETLEKSEVEIERRETSDERRDTEPQRLGEVLPAVLDNIKKRIESKNKPERLAAREIKICRK